MANQAYWNKIAQQEIANGQKSQNTDRMTTSDREKYQAALAQQRQQPQPQNNR